MSSCVSSGVTPFAGVWIEIIKEILNVKLGSSLPSRECGLKLCCTCATLLAIWSLPSRECGLKWNISSSRISFLSVTPFAGVWIEIWLPHESNISIDVTPFAGVWIEISQSRRPALRLLVTPFAGVWIEIFLTARSSTDSCSHSLRGSVDWNDNTHIESHIIICHSLRGSVDWNWPETACSRIIAASLPSRECGLKLIYAINTAWTKSVTPFAGVWIEILYPPYMLL